MKFWGKPDGLFLGLVALTAASKVLITKYDMSPSDDVVTSRLADVFREAGFSAQLQFDPPAGNLVEAVNGSCRMWARDYSPYGIFLSYYESEAASVGPLVFVYQGAVNSRPPKFRPLLRYYLARELNRLGLDAYRPPIVAVAASRKCDLNAIEWHRIAEVPW